MSIITIGGGHSLTVSQGIMDVGRNEGIQILPNGVWYDFSDISTMWQDDTRTTPVTTDGQRIGAIDDKTGNGQHLTQPGVNIKPSYSTNRQNGLSVADCDVDSNAQYIDRITAFWTTIPRPYSLFTVARTPDTVDISFSRGLIAASDTSGSGSVNMWLGPTGGGFSGSWLYRTQGTSGVKSVLYADFAAVGADTWYISEMHAPVAGNYVVYQQNMLDGITLAAEDIARGFRIGHDRNLGGKANGAWQGLVGEVRVYDYDANAGGQRTAIYNELKAKWGL